MSTALITGASSGIGRAIAHVFARQQYNVILVARREDLLNSLKQELSKYPVKVDIFPMDLTQLQAGEKLLAWTKSKNLNVDVLINNAGFGEFGDFHEISLARQLNMIQLNISSLTELTHLFLPSMLQQKKGHIINIASTAAFQPGPTMAVYFATKSYVLSLSEALSEELCGSGVHVTAICPGPTQSEFVDVAHMRKSNLFKPRSIPTSEELAEFTWKAMKGKRVVAIHGLANNFLIQTLRFSPRVVVRKIAKWVLRANA